MVRRLLSDPNKIHVEFPNPDFGEIHRLQLRIALKRRVQIEYHDGAYLLARRYLPGTIIVLARKFGSVDVVLEFNETERCDSRCQTADPATFYNCTCSCLARNHGGVGNGPEWVQVGDTALINQSLHQQCFIVTREQVAGLTIFVGRNDGTEPLA